VRPSEVHVKELDGLRGIAVLLVIVWHYTTGLLDPALAWNGAYRAGELSLYVAATKWTWAGVDLFFVLSGFLIGGILLDMTARRRAGEATKLSVRGFYLRRFFRIVPVFLLMLLLLAICRLWPGAPRSYMFGGAETTLWPQLTFFQNYIHALSDLKPPVAAGVSWSLAVEEQFYLIVPALIFLCRGKLMMVSILAALFVIIAVAGRALTEGWVQGYVLTHLRMDGLALGILVAVFIRSHLYAQSSKWVGWVALALGGLALLSLLSHYETFRMGDARLHFEIAMISASVIFLAWHWRGRKRVSLFRMRWLCGIGAISYALYLFHQLCAGVVFAVFRGTDRPELNSA